MELEEAIEEYRREFECYEVYVDSEREFKFLESLIQLENESIWDVYGDEHYEIFKKLRKCSTDKELIAVLEEEHSNIVRISGIFQIINFRRGIAKLGFGQRGLNILDKLFKFVDEKDS